MAERMMKAEGITREEARRRQAEALPTKRERRASIPETREYSGNSDNTTRVST